MANVAKAASMTIENFRCSFNSRRNARPAGFTLRPIILCEHRYGRLKSSTKSDLSSIFLPSKHVAAPVHLGVCAIVPLDCCWRQLCSIEAQLLIAFGDLQFLQHGV
jgi:hypothetical protein